MKDFPFQKEIALAAYSYNLDPLMVRAVVETESNFNPNAVSPVGAVGLMQLMPGTDKWLDGDIDGTDPQGNLDNGCRYLAFLRRWVTWKHPDYGRFADRPDEEGWFLAWAGYNAGQGNMDKAIALSQERFGVMPGLLFENWRKALPEITGKHAEETINYVQKINKYWKGYLEA